MARILMRAFVARFPRMAGFASAGCTYGIRCAFAPCERAAGSVCPGPALASQARPRQRSTYQSL